jgi:thiamine-monophosphate kinase
MDEFSFIDKLLKPLTKDCDESLGLNDDVAKINNNQFNDSDIIISKDLLSSNVHFRITDGAKNIARKILAANLSDLASSGAIPKYYLLGIARNSNIDDNFWQEFTAELAKIQKEYRISLIGGDTINYKSEDDNLLFSVTVIGKVLQNSNLQRNKAKNGDLIWVSGNIGDAFLGLNIINSSFNIKGSYNNFIAESYSENQVKQGNNKISKKNQLFYDKKSLTSAYYRPQPQLLLGQELVNHNLSCAASDISDGLLQDLNNIAKSSNLIAKIFLDKIPLSRASKRFIENFIIYSNKYQQRSGLKQYLGKSNKIINDKIIEDLITAGDDYQLIFTSDPIHKAEIEMVAKKIKVKLTNIGEMINLYDKKLTIKDKKQNNLLLLNNNKELKPIKITKIGYEH